MAGMSPPDPRRVLLVGERADFYGGGQRSLLDLARALGRSAFQPVVVLPGPGPLAEALRSESFQVHHLPLPRVSPLHAGRLLGSVHRLAGLARAEGIAILHSDAPRAALHAGLAARLIGARHVWHLRSSQAGARGVDRLLVRLSDQVIAVSRAAANRSAALRRAPRVAVIPTGIRPPDFLDRRTARAILDLPHDRLIVGVVGRVEEDKGGADALAVLKRLKLGTPAPWLAFLGASEPESPFARALVEQANALGIADRVRFTGDRPDAARLFRAFDLILHPSRHEALPRVLIEALWASVPVAAYGVGGVPEVLGTGTEAGGLMAPPRRTEALARIAERLALDPDLRGALGVVGLARARERFSIDRMRAAILACYESLVPAAPGAQVAA